MEKNVEMITIPSYVLEMVTFTGFLKRYHYYRESLKTNTEAFKATQKEFYKYYKLRRYNTAQSFFNQVYYYHKKKINGNKRIERHFKFAPGLRRNEKIKRGRPEKSKE